MHTSGGRVSIVVNGIVYSARGVVKLNASRVQVEVAANQDGSIYKTVKPQPAMAECTFDRFISVANGLPLKWDESLLLQNNLAATFIEQDTGISHLLTKGSFMGEPGQDLSTGETDGLKFAAESYETIT